MICNWILYSIDPVYPKMTKIPQFAMPKMSKIAHYLFYEKCQKSRYFCGRILAKILRSRKVYEVFHVWSPLCYPYLFSLIPYLVSNIPYIISLSLISCPLTLYPSSFIPPSLSYPFVSWPFRLTILRRGVGGGGGLGVEWGETWDENHKWDGPAASTALREL